MKRYLLCALCLLNLYFGIHDGHIALKRSGQSTPLQIFPYSIALYPESDLVALEQGLPVADSMDMAKLMEDYFS